MKEKQTEQVNLFPLVFSWLSLLTGFFIRHAVRFEYQGFAILFFILAGVFFLAFIVIVFKSPKEKDR